MEAETEWKERELSIVPQFMSKCLQIRRELVCRQSWCQYTKKTADKENGIQTNIFICK